MDVGKPRILAVDYGKKRVGLAVSDPMRWFAQPLGTYAPREALHQIRQYCQQNVVEQILIGWPLTEDGEEGEATEWVQAYINRLSKMVPAVPILKRDERFSSQLARAAIRAAGARQKARRDKGRVDAAAAAIILQAYLDEHG